MMSLIPDIVPRFSAKAAAYKQYRWPFDQRAVKTLLRMAALSPGAVVADMGSGTGMSSRPFLREGYRVFGIEPNTVMRQMAEMAFTKNANFISIDGRAEESGLADNFVDLIVAGRAIHWFPQAETRREFARISKPDGWLAIMAVTCADEDLLADTRSVFRAEYGWDEQASKFNRPVQPLAYFFEAGSYQELRGCQLVRETWLQFLGRLLTLSTAPDIDHIHYHRYEQRLREIFDTYQENGELLIPAETRIALGHPAGHKSGTLKANSRH